MNASQLICLEPEKIYAYCVQIEMAQGGTIYRCWRVRRIGLARSMAMRVAGAVRVVHCMPLTKEQWDAASGKQSSTTVNNRQPR